jgi:hypothetical protein
MSSILERAIVVFNNWSESVRSSLVQKEQHSVDTKNNWASHFKDRTKKYFPYLITMYVQTNAKMRQFNHKNTTSHVS